MEILKALLQLPALVEELNSGKKVEDIKVVDNSSLKFIEPNRWCVCCWKLNMPTIE